MAAGLTRRQSNNPIAQATAQQWPAGDAHPRFSIALCYAG
jgi:hypothetical protein